MKILGFTDLHLSVSAFKKLKQKVKQHKPDLIICCGDHTVFDNQKKQITKKIAQLGAPVFIIHGNHEARVGVKKEAMKYKNMMFIHKKIVEYNGYTFLAWGGGGFSYKYPAFEAFVEKNKSKLKGKKLIFVTHAPPFGTKLDVVLDSHVGSKSFMSFVKKYKNNLRLYMSGHIHECMKQKQKIGNCLMVNPGADGMVVKV